MELVVRGQKRCIDYIDCSKLLPKCWTMVMACSSIIEPNSLILFPHVYFRVEYTLLVGVAQKGQDMFSVDVSLTV